MEGGSYYLLYVISFLCLIAPSWAVEHCFFSLINCRSYCCSRGGSPFLDYCCSDCSLSVNLGTRNSFWCTGHLSPMGMLSAVTAALILISIIIGITVCLCCGCICSGVTGRTNPWRRSTNEPNASMRSSSTVATSVDCVELPPPYDTLPAEPVPPPTYDAVGEQRNAAEVAESPPPAYTEAQPASPSVPIPPDAPLDPPAYSVSPPAMPDTQQGVAK